MDVLRWIHESNVIAKYESPQKKTLVSAFSPSKRSLGKKKDSTSAKEQQDDKENGWVNDNESE